MPVILLNPYALLADVQQETRNTDAAEVDALNTAINIASRYVDDYCLRDFLFHDFSSTPIQIARRDVIGSKFWMRWPILTLTQITVNGDVVDPTDYYFEAGSYEIEYWDTAKEWFYINGNMQDMPNVNWMGENWPGPSGYPNERNVRPTPIIVTGTFGYPAQAGDTTPPALPPVGLPAAVQRACTLIAAAWSGENRKETVGLSGDKVALFDSRIPPEAKMLLDRWKWQFI